MTHRFTRTAALLALAAFSTFALAQEEMSSGEEPPGRVGRVSLIQGKVSIGSGVGDAVQDALVNGPVTSQNLITTAPGARTEIRIGSTSVRLDGDSSLEVTELDDDSLRLRLHYGSASVRIVSADVAPEFELVTVQARVRMQQPGRLRVDAERAPDTSVVSVFDGEAVVEGAGASLLVRAGRSAEVRDDDVRTLQARRDSFDDWSLTRDSYEDSSRSSRYVTTDMTGYEDLDRHGSWSLDAEYGSLWTPSVAAGWAPYRDGRWTWIAPWGWTWVDNASWGYAPFHYGRWVYHKRRWAWAPGQRERRPLPAQGWYPLGPRDRFVPGYRLSDDRLRRLNTHNWRDGDRKDGHDERHNERRNDRHDNRRDDRREGLTVVPNEHFGQRGDRERDAQRVDRSERLDHDQAIRDRAVLENATRDRTDRMQAIQDQAARDRAVRDRAVWENAAQDRIDRDRVERLRSERERDDWNRGERSGRDREDRDRFARGQRAPLLATDPAPSQPGAMLGASPPVAPQPVAAQPTRPQSWQRPDRDRRDGFDEDRRQRPPQAVPTPQPAPRATPEPSAPARMQGEQRAHTDERGVRHQER